MDALAALRRYWQDDAPAYDRGREHGAWSPGERGTWTAALTRLLPAPGAKLVDVGPGTCFLSLAAVPLGYDVTALDISAGMLERLRATAAEAELHVHAVGTPAHDPPGPFGAVIERPHCRHCLIPTVRCARGEKSLQDH